MVGKNGAHDRGFDDASEPLLLGNERLVMIGL
jgi:hypothetical protein